MRLSSGAGLRSLFFTPRHGCRPPEDGVIQARSCSCGSHLSYRCRYEAR